MAITLGAKVAAGVVLLIAAILGQLYVLSLHWEVKSRIVRAEFVLLIETFVFCMSFFVWRNFSSLFDNDQLSLKKAKFSDADLQSKTNEKPNGRKWTKWKIFLFSYLVTCHLSYLTNLFFIGRNPFVIAYSCYAAVGLLIQIVTGLVVIKCVSFFVKLFKKESFITRKRKLHIVLLYSISIWIYGMHNAQSPPTVKTVEVPILGLPNSLNGMKIVQISDIHLGPTVGRWRLERIVNMINELNADAVVMTGDLVDGRVASLTEAVEPMINVKAKLGKYFVSGNHEYYTGDVDNWFAHLTSLGFAVLHNRNVKLPRDDLPADQQICLAGTDDIQADTIGYGDHGMKLDLALSSCSGDQPVILLAHQPKAAKIALDSKHKIDLVISGHTHGGQFFPVIFAAYIANPFFRGLYKYGDHSHVYVSVGTQYWGIPVRIGTTMEITQIMLKGE